MEDILYAFEAVAECIGFRDIWDLFKFESRMMGWEEIFEALDLAMLSDAEPDVVSGFQSGFDDMGADEACGSGDVDS